MKNIKRTKLMLSLWYTLIFMGIFLVLGLAFFSIKYFSKNNIEILETKISNFEKTGEGNEIDDIFKELGEYALKDELKKKQYSVEEFKQDIVYFSFFLVFLSFVFFYVSLKLITKTMKGVEENMDDMKDFIDNAGHELKTPLAAIDSSIQLMNAKKEFDPDLLEKSQKEILKTNKLIETLRDLSNITSISKKEKFRVNESIQEILNKYGNDIKKKNITVKINTLEDFGLYVNKNYFEILFSNIISNAIKYNKESGLITITIVSQSIVIEDSGIGITKNKVDKIFNRFYRVKQHRNTEGFGLGLSIVEKIIKIYNWNINVESKLGIGTKIILRFN